MVTYTFAGDESGDVSFAFDKGASRYFVVAAIETTQPDELRSQLADLRHRAGLKANYEFSFHSLSSGLLRRRTFESLAGADFACRAVIVDKPALPDTFRVMRRLDFYLFFVTELIQLIPASQRAGATLILDEYGSANRLRTELRRFMKARSIAHQFRRIVARRSSSEPLIQVADLMAGAILRRDAGDRADMYDIVEHKIKQVLEFRGQ